ncbi:MAG: hypothetical protein ACHP9Y_01385, partial [Gammaproteobacteria bacterium]
MINAAKAAGADNTKLATQLFKTLLTAAGAKPTSFGSFMPEPFSDWGKIGAFLFRNPLELLFKAPYDMAKDEAEQTIIKLKLNKIMAEAYGDTFAITDAAAKFEKHVGDNPKSSTGKIYQEMKKPGGALDSLEKELAFNTSQAEIELGYGKPPPVTDAEKAQRKTDVARLAADKTYAKRGSDPSKLKAIQEKHHKRLEEEA